MKALINYVQGNEKSEFCTKLLVDSLVENNWEYELVPGITPNTLNEEEFPWPDLKDSRFASFHKNHHKKYLIKKSCFFNHLRFAQRVIDEGTPMVFLEHDVLAIAPPKEIEFTDYCFLALKSAFDSPSVLAKTFGAYRNTLRTFDPPTEVFELVKKQYPLAYKKPNNFFGAIMTPGTAAYCLSPSGAEKLLTSAEKNGLEQSDYSYNSKVMKIEAIIPCLFKHQETNPNLSHRLEE